jgi:hypothetical protein
MLTGARYVLDEKLSMCRTCVGPMRLDVGAAQFRFIRASGHQPEKD